MKLPILFLASMGGLFAQTFDVASVRRLSDTEAIRVRSGSITAQHGVVTMHGVSMQLAMRWAFRLQSYQLRGPAWIYWNPTNTQPRFDIQAKADPKTPDEQLRVMMKDLLSERFGLKYHVTESEVACYVLSVAPEGLKMIPADEAGLILYDPDKGLASLTGVTPENLAEELYQSLQTPIVDRTGLKGAYTGKVHLAQQPHDEVVESVLKGFRRELGLQLTKGKTVAKIVRIDAIIEFPTEN